MWPATTAPGIGMEFREDENPITDLLDGKLTTHTYLAPYIPAEKIVNIREYDTAALEAALTGGRRVTHEQEYPDQGQQLQCVQRRATSCWAWGMN